MVKSRTYIATPPGATIKEQLVERGISQKEFAVRMGMSEKHISKLINGEVQLTPEVAIRLEMVLDIPAKFWNKLEATYREKIIKANAENEMDAEIELAKKFPYSDMSKNGWIPETRKITEKVINLRKYFEVANLSILFDSRLPRIACRRLSETKKADFALLAWSQQAKYEARAIKTSPINLKKLSKEIPKIRKLTRMNPNDFCSILSDILANCGIALVLLPHIEGSFLHGATFQDGNKIVIGLTVRGKDADKFWFSLFHELGHILLGHIEQPNELTQEDEIAADQFAQETLISTEVFHDFILQNNFTRTSIKNFAESNDILCGIVVGRLQKENYIKYNMFNDLKIKYQLK